jgi:hypothetical protein
MRMGGEEQTCRGMIPMRRVYDGSRRFAERVERNQSGLQSKEEIGA